MYTRVVIRAGLNFRIPLIAVGIVLKGYQYLLHQHRQADGATCAAIALETPDASVHRVLGSRKSFFSTQS